MSAADGEPDATSKTPLAKRPRPRWWRRWLRRLLVTAVIARVLLAVSLEQLADFGAGFAGLSVSWRSHSLSLLGLSLHIDDLEVRVRDVDVAEPLLHAQELIADLSMRQLLSGQLSVVDVGLVGAKATVYRAADGTLQLPPAWLTPAATTEPAPVAEPPQPLHFELPLRIGSARLHDLRFELVDATSTPPMRRDGTLDVDLADVGFADRSGALNVRVHAPAWFDDLRLRAGIEMQRERAALTFSFALRGVRPGAFELPDAVSRAIDHANVLDLALDGQLSATVLPAAPLHPALEGDVELRLQLDDVERAHSHLALGPTDAAATARGAVATPFSLAMHLHDTVERLQVQDGRLGFDEHGTRLSGTLEAERVTPRRTRELLAAAGVELTDRGVDLSARFDVTAGETLSLQLDDFTIGPDAAHQLALPRVVLRGLGTAQGALTLDELAVVGPELELRREADGTLALAGLRFLLPATPPPDAPPSPPAAAPPTATPVTPRLPKLRVGKVDWRGVALRFVDATMTPPATLALEDLRVNGSGLVCGEAAPPGTLQVTAKVPDAIGQLQFTARLAPSVDGLHADAELRSSGLGGDALVPWLEPLGLACDLRQGNFGFALAADLHEVDDGLTIAARLADLRLVDGEQQWLKIRAVTGNNLRVTATGLELGDWLVTEPFAAVRRDVDGTLHLLGTRRLAAGAATTAPPPKPLPRAERLPDASQPLVRHGELRVEGAVLSFVDLASGPTPRAFGLDASLGANDGAGAALPARVTLRMPGAIEQLEVDASLRLLPAELAVTAKVTGRGLRGAGLDGVLPPGVRCTLVDGALDLQLEANAGPDRLLATLRGLRLTDGAAELFAVDELLLRVPRFGADEVHVEELTLRGVRSLQALTEAALQVPGFALATSAASPPTGETPPTAPSEAPPTAAQRAAALSAAAPPTAAPPTEAPATEAPATEAPPTEAPRATPLTLPTLTIDAVRLQFERLELRDRRAGEAPPLTLQAELTLDRPWRGNAKAEPPEPLQCTLRAYAAPLGAHLELHFEVSPLAPSPTLDMALELRGFDTTRLGEVLPSLSAQLRGDARALEAGAELHALLQLRRRDVTQFEFGRPFGFEVHLSDVVLRDAASERTFVSVATIDVVARSFDPRSGDLLLRSIDVDAPSLTIARHADGLHLLGFVLPPANAPPGPPPPAPTPMPPTTPVAVAADAELAEVAIDRLRVFGTAVDFTDATTAPATALRLADTDLELLRFSTAVLHEARPFSFTLTARGGDIELPQRIVHSSLVHGLLSAAGQLAVGEDQLRTEQRPMLDQAVFEGRLELWPQPKGRITIAIDTLELPAFRGLAKQAGVELSDGTYDLRAAANLRGYDGIDIASRQVLTWLSLNEPANGPISTYLRLPAPLQTVLFLLRNAAGEQRLPIDLHLPADGISQESLVELAVTSLTRVISDAVAGAGSRVTQMITDPLFGGNEPAVVTVEATFRPGSPLPGDLSLQTLAAAIEADPTLSVVLTHELGQADVHHAAELANPEPARVEATVGELREERDRLEQRRAPLASEVTALYLAAKYPEARQRHTELWQLDTRLGELQTTLRLALDQLSAQGPRAARRRTRTAIEALAAARCDALEARLRATLPELDPSRIERRLGRASPTEGLDDGGRVVLLTRRRLPDEKLDPSRRPPERSTPRLFDEAGGPSEPALPSLPRLPITSPRQP